MGGSAFPDKGEQDISIGVTRPDLERRAIAPPVAPVDLKRPNGFTAHCDSSNLYSLVESLPLAAFVLQDGRIVHANLISCALFDLDVQALLRRRLSELVAEESRQTMRAVLDEVNQGRKQNASMEIKIGVEGGRTRWTQLALSRILLESGVSLLATAVDVTQAKLAVGSLETFCGAVDQARDAVMITNCEGIIQFINPSFTRMTGFSEAEAVGRTPRLLKSGVHEAEFYASLWNTILSGRIHQSVFRNRRKDGSYFYMEQTITPIGVKDAVSHFVSTSRDITDKVLWHEEHVRRERLEAIGEAIAGVSHAVKGIVSRMDGSMTLMERALAGNDAEGTVKVWPILQRSIRELSTLVMETLAYASERRPELSPVCINEIAWQIMEICRRDAQKKNIQLDFRPADPLPKILGQRSAIVSAMFNIVDNAIQACEEAGGGEISLSTTLDEAAGRVHLEITDNGPGIPEELRDRIFQPFFSSKGAKGHGLGLPITQKIIQEHGGHITHESQPGRTRFLISLPATGLAHPPETTME